MISSDKIYDKFTKRVLRNTTILDRKLFRLEYKNINMNNKCKMLVVLFDSSFTKFSSIKLMRFCSHFFFFFYFIEISVSRNPLQGRAIRSQTITAFHMLSAFPFFFFFFFSRSHFILHAAFVHASKLQVCVSIHNLIVVKTLENINPMNCCMLQGNFWFNMRENEAKNDEKLNEK